MPSVGREIRVAPADALAPSRAVLEALVCGREIPTGEDGRSAVAVVSAAYASHEAGGVPTSVDAALPSGRRFSFA